MNKLKLARTFWFHQKIPMVTSNSESLNAYKWEKVLLVLRRLLSVGLIQITVSKRFVKVKLKFAVVEQWK